MSDDTVDINLSGIKKTIAKNNFTLGFSITAFVFLIVSLIVHFEIGVDKLQNLILLNFFFLFPSSLWFFLTVVLIFSAVSAYYKKYSIMFLPILIWLLFTTGFVRTQNIPDLKDVTTNDWILGPDLDPFLFLRHAIEISEGRLENPDSMRYSPLGTPNYALTNTMPWAIFYVYKIINNFGDYSVTYAAIISPVIFFVLSVIFFFFFVAVLFSFKFSKAKSTLAATIATTLYIFSPSMLHRTTAGIPELESLGILWFWAAFLFFTLAWKQDYVKNKTRMIVFGLLAGLFTGAMSWVWGGYAYIYMTIGLATFIAFLFQIEKKKNLAIFTSWAFVSLLILFLKTQSLSSLILSFSDTGFVLGILFIMLVDLGINHSKLKSKLKLNKLNLPDSINSILISIVVVFIGLLIINPSFLFNVFSGIIERLLYPFGRSRVGLTVAENRAPYFIEVFKSFGWFLWAFLFGVILMFYEATKHFKKKIRISLNLFFIVFVATFIFSRISPEHLLNGENFISKILYLGGLVVFGLFVLYTFVKAHKSKDEKTISDFKEIKISYFLLLAFSFWAIVSMRGAIRLFFIIAPLIILGTVYFIMRFSEYAYKTKDSLSKLFLWSALIIMFLLLLNTFAFHAVSTTQTANAMVPSAYNQQWQKSMAWVRDNTPEGSIFVHWWDYGYWVQTMGERPTIADGGHFQREFGNHMVGRYVLTTPKPEAALSFMKTNGISYLLIDSTDLGKYSAYSKIGSDEKWDRFSVITTMVLDKGQSTETVDGEMKIYQGTTGVDEDIVYEIEGRQVFLPGPMYDEFGSPDYKSFVIGTIIETSQENGERSFSQPEVIFFYNNAQHRIPVKYIYYNDRILDFGSGIDATIFVMPAIFQTTQGIQIDDAGALIYLSPKTKDTLFAQLYLMNDPFDRYSTITLAHSQKDAVAESLLMQGLDMGDFLYYQGFRGPIKIWGTTNIPENIVTYGGFLRREGTYAEFDNVELVRSF